jgi:hypothetical protein
MTVDFSTVSIGDRVRLTRENPYAITEFDVTEIMPLSDRAFLRQKINGGIFEVYRNDWDTLEIVLKSLPTEPGHYVEADADLSNGNSDFYFFGPHSGWMWDGGDNGWEPLPEKDVPRNLVKLVKA